MLKVKKRNNLDKNIFEYLIQQCYEWKTLKKRGATIREGAIIRDSTVFTIYGTRYGKYAKLLSNYHPSESVHPKLREYEEIA